MLLTEIVATGAIVNRLNISWQGLNTTPAEFSHEYIFFETAWTVPLNSRIGRSITIYTCELLRAQPGVRLTSWVELLADGVNRDSFKSEISGLIGHPGLSWCTLPWSFKKDWAQTLHLHLICFDLYQALRFECQAYKVSWNVETL